MKIWSKMEEVASITKTNIRLINIINGEQSIKLPIYRTSSHKFIFPKNKQEDPRIRWVTINHYNTLPAWKKLSPFSEIKNIITKLLHETLTTTPACISEMFTVYSRNHPGPNHPMLCPRAIDDSLRCFGRWFPNPFSLLPNLTYHIMHVTPSTKYCQQ